MKQYPKVSVCIITYGHEKFIEQAINGVLIQVCNFEVELIIANDCSPDQTDEVIQNILKNHPRASWIKYTKHDKNLGMMSNLIFALQECKGEFIAMCEGDDYWTDPLKLKKQVDFLEKNKFYNIVWTKYNIVNHIGEVKKENIPVFNELLSDVTIDNFFEVYRTLTLTSMFRAKIIIGKKLSNFKHLKDNTIYFLALLNSKGRVLDFNSACYRIHKNGIWSSGTLFENHLANFYNFEEIKNKIINSQSLVDITRYNLKRIFENLIGFENCKIREMQIYNKFFFVIINRLDWNNKLKFLKWYSIKIISKKH